MGLVTKLLTSPTKFEPVPFSEGVHVLLESRMKKTTELQEKVKKLFENEPVKRKIEIWNYEFKVIPERAPWFNYLHKKFATCQMFDMLTSGERFAARMIYDEELYRKAAKQSCRIRILTEKHQLHSPVASIIDDLEKYPNFEIRYAPTSPEVMLITIDKKEAVLAIAPSTQIGPPYLISNHPSLVLLAQKYFETKWQETPKQSINPSLTQQT